MLDQPSNLETTPTFDGVAAPLAEALAKRGYTDLTPVQKAVLTPEHQDVDALVSAQTGSGKTVAFGLNLAPTLLEGAERFQRTKVPLALVVAPTRELAVQVKRELDWLYAPAKATIATCVGGMDMRSERRMLERGAHIVVGTPGRLCDHIRRNSLDTSELKAVVLDEADEMLDLGFKEDLEFILETTPEDRRTLMFSATVPKSIANLARQYQRDAVRITTQEEKRQHVDIEYRALMVAAHERENAIINVLRFYEAKNALVFCNTRATVNHMTARFNNRGFSVVALSGELTQNERTHALQAMRNGRARICIATDVAARGIDLPNLELVIHAELPTNPETLLHRSGRTGRAGNKGVSALIVPHNGRKRAERLLKMARLNATWAKPPSAEEVSQKDDERILADPLLNDPLQKEEFAFVRKILSEHEPEQVAAAFVRLYRAGQSAPEELQDIEVKPPEPKKFRKDDFEESVWFSVSVGRKQNAEPRWLIPMLCGAGEITKREIGAIRMQQEETWVQIDARCEERFLEAVGPKGKLEKNIRIKRLDEAPEAGEDKFKASKKRKPYQGKKPFSGGKPDRAKFDDGRSGRKKFAGKKPFDKTKPGGKKAGKRKFAKTADA